MRSRRLRGNNRRVWRSGCGSLGRFGVDFFLDCLVLGVFWGGRGGIWEGGLVVGYDRLGFLVFGFLLSVMRNVLLGWLAVFVAWPRLAYRHL